MFVDLWVFILYTVIETFVIMSVSFLLVYKLCSSLKSKALNVDHVPVTYFLKMATITNSVYWLKGPSEQCHIAHI